MEGGAKVGQIVRYLGYFGFDIEQFLFSHGFFLGYIIA